MSANRATLLVYFKVDCPGGSAVFRDAFDGPAEGHPLIEYQHEYEAPPNECWMSQPLADVSLDKFVPDKVQEPYTPIEKDTRELVESFGWKLMGWHLILVPWYDGVDRPFPGALLSDCPADG